LIDALASRRARLPASLRYAYLLRATARLEAAAVERPSAARRASLLACQLALGAVAGARRTVEALLIDDAQGLDFAPDEPVLAPVARFERRFAGGDGANWLRAMINAAFLERAFLSVQFNPVAATAAARSLEPLGYADATSERCRQLCGVLLGERNSVSDSSQFHRPDAGMLNAKLWRDTDAAWRAAGG